MQHKIHMHLRRSEHVRIEEHIERGRGHRDRDSGEDGRFTWAGLLSMRLGGFGYFGRGRQNVGGGLRVPDLPNLSGCE